MKSPHRHSLSHEKRIGLTEHTHLTTGNAAAILGISQQTVIRMFDMAKGGESPMGFCTPPSKHRRLFKDQVADKAVEIGQPEPKLYPTTLVPANFDTDYDVDTFFPEEENPPNVETEYRRVEYHDAMTLAMEMADHPVTRIVVSGETFESHPCDVRKQVIDMCQEFQYPPPEFIDEGGRAIPESIKEYVDML